MITFKEFVERIELSESSGGENRFREAFDILEVNRPEQGSDVEKSRWDKANARRNALEDPSSVEIGSGGRDKNGNQRYKLNNAGRRKKEAQERKQKEKETAITQNQLRDAAKRDVTKSNPDERAAAAYDTEQERMSGITKRVTKTSKSSGVKQSKDHKQPLQRKAKNPENQERLDRVLPGHNSDNLEIKPLVKNSSKQNTPPKQGESGYGLTRASVTRTQLNRGDKLLGKVGREIGLTQSGRPSRAARLLSYLRRAKPRDTGAAQRMAAAYDKRVGRSFEN